MKLQLGEIQLFNIQNSFLEEPSHLCHSSGKLLAHRLHHKWLRFCGTTNHPYTLHINTYIAQTKCYQRTNIRMHIIPSRSCNLSVSSCNTNGLGLLAEIWKHSPLSVEDKRLPGLQQQRAPSYCSSNVPVECCGCLAVTQPPIKRTFGHVS